MEIAFVSTFGQPCGIATYTRDLARALEDHGAHVTVLAEASETASKETPPNVYRIWRRGHVFDTMYGLSAILRAIDSSPRKPDVVHIQHEFGIFTSNADLTKLIEGLRHRNIKVWLTLHTVFTGPRQSDFFDDLPPAATIVHTLAAHFVLTSYSHLVPHGTHLRAARSPSIRRAARTKLQIDTTARWSALCPGFLSPSKNLEEILRAFTEVRNQQLVLVGECRSDAYLASVQSLIHDYGLTSRVVLRLGYQSDAMMDLYFRAADYVILGGVKTTPYSASGQLHTAAGYGLPILAKNTQIYRESPALLYTDHEDLARFSAGMDTLPAQNALSIDAYNFATGRQWKDVARRHLDLYAA